ncbi:MAG TPA: hypothetical protein DEB05_09760 [Firmicutes bacterium]|jgi:hypothetical protein|nr:hypothetical protein [Bacillota bacterium]
MLTPEEVKRFIITTLQVSGASYRQVDEDLLLAEVTVEIPPLFFDPARLEKHTLNLVFTPEAGAVYPGSELVVPGSYRLNWFLEGIKERGNYTLQRFSYEFQPAKTQQEIEELLPAVRQDFFLQAPSFQMRPYLGANYTLSYRTDELREELVSPGLDMVSGEVIPNFFELLAAAPAIPGAPEEGVEQQRYTLEQAFALLHNYLQEIVQAKDPLWVEEARTRYEEELYCLYQYYQEDNRDTNDFKSRAHELYDKFRPRVLARLVNLGLLYLPEVIYSAPSPTGKERPTLRYSPLLKKVEGIGSNSPK